MQYVLYSPARPVLPSTPLRHYNRPQVEELRLQLRALQVVSGLGAEEAGSGGGGLEAMLVDKARHCEHEATVARLAAAEAKGAIHDASIGEKGLGFLYICDCAAASARQQSHALPRRNPKVRSVSHNCEWRLNSPFP